MWRFFIAVPIITLIYLYSHSKLEELNFQNFYQQGPQIEKHTEKIHFQKGIFYSYGNYLIAGKVIVFSNSILEIETKDKIVCLFILNKKQNIQEGKNIILSGLIGSYYKGNAIYISSLEKYGPNVIFLEKIKII